MDIGNFPDKFVSKEDLIKEYFPSFHPKTLSNYLTVIRKDEKWRQILLSPSSRLTLINVKGFFAYLRWREERKFRV